MTSAKNQKAEYVGGRLYVGWSGRVFYAPRSKVVQKHDDGTATLAVVGKKYDVTESFDECVKERAKAKRRAAKDARRNDMMRDIPCI